MTEQRYSLYARTVSSDIAFMDLAESPERACAAVRIRELRRQEAPDAMLIERDFLTFEDSEGLTYVARRVGDFHIAADGKTIEHNLLPEAQPLDVQYLLTGPVLCLALQLQGDVLLHSVGLKLGKSSIALAGHHAAGKSTLAAWFQHYGIDVLTDDVLPLRDHDDSFLAQQSVPWIKLGPDTLAAMETCSEDYPLVRTGAEKRRYPRISVSEDTDCTSDSPLKRVYILRPQTESSQRIHFETLSGVDAVLAVLQNMHGAASFTGKRGRFAFDAAHRIASRVGVRAVEYHRSYENLPVVGKAILRENEESSSASS